LAAAYGGVGSTQAATVSASFDSCCLTRPKDASPHLLERRDGGEGNPRRGDGQHERAPQQYARVGTIDPSLVEVGAMRVSLAASPELRWLGSGAWKEPEPAHDDDLPSSRWPADVTASILCSPLSSPRRRVVQPRPRLQGEGQQPFSLRLPFAKSGSSAVRLRLHAMLPKSLSAGDRAPGAQQ
jgi:hypothetical protein